MRLSRYFFAKKTVLLSFLLLLSLFFAFRPLYYSGLWNIVFFISFVFFFLCFLRQPKSIFSNRLYFSYVLICFCFLLSIVSSLFLGGQSLYYSLKGFLSVNYTPLFLLFFLAFSRINVSSIEKVLIGLFLIYLCVYLFSVFSYPRYLFGMVSTEQIENIAKDIERRGVFRFALPYEDVITLVMFMLLSKKGLSSPLNIILFILTVIMTISRGTRTAIAVTMCFSLILFFRVNFQTWFTKSHIARGHIAISKRKLSIVIFALLLILLAMFAFTPRISTIIQGLSEATQQDQSEGSNNIRILMSTYYLFEYNTTLPEILFGHGIPILGKFANDIASMSQYGYWPVDVGYVDIYLQFGIVGIIIFLNFIYFVIKTKVPSKYLYAKYFIFYVYVSMITGQYFLRNLALIAISTYVLIASSYSSN